MVEIDPQLRTLSVLDISGCILLDDTDIAKLTDIDF